MGTKYDGEGPTVWDLLEPGWLHSNFPAGYGDAAGDAKATDLGPQDVEWLGRVSGLPVVVKGVLRADDARRCVDAGAAAVWVSNHGGRQLDQTAATAERLAAVADAVGADGVTRLLDELDEELEETLRLAGCPFASRVPAGVLHG